ncbi:MAG TPA: amidohydrolase [Candidatus Limnocylindrales bacterium]|nr:amidohydrolase [Candidatus Limnocylindrales bacterium]
MAGAISIVNGTVLGTPGATAVAVTDGRIAAVGGRELARQGGEVIDAGGGLIMPGFDDAHLHLLGGARSMSRAQLYPLGTVEAILDEVRRHAEADPSAPWVLGRGWLYAPFPGAMPTAALLDAVVPGRPVWLDCYDGHTGWGNTAAMRLAGIDRETPDPPNGLIVRDENGEPAGAFKEAAQLLVERHIPRPTEAEDRASVRRALAAMHERGLTAAQDAWLEPAELASWERIHAAGELDLRFRGALIMEPGQTLAEWRDRLDAYEAQAFPLRGGATLDSGILKGFVDGVIEARTASMLAPYQGDASAGMPAWEPDELNAFVAEADRRGWQVELHAIGDRGVRLALDAFEQAARVNGPWAGDPHGTGAVPGTHARRHRVEHIETIDPADVGRFGSLGVIASMQPYHGDPSPNQVDVWAGNIGPERAGRAWAWRSIREGGGTLAFGSDWPVVPFDPFSALNNAVNRQTRDGLPAGGWLPGERLTVAEALEAYTAGSACAAFAESRRGRIAPGIDADLAVLDRDLLAAGPSAIIGTDVRLTVIGGRIVHRSEGRT